VRRTIYICIRLLRNFLRTYRIDKNSLSYHTSQLFCRLAHIITFNDLR